MVTRLAISMAVFLVTTYNAAAYVCDPKPIITIGEEPYEPGSDVTMETITVDGIRWSHRYLKSAALGVLRYGTMPDCHRVLVLGRKGLDTYATIDDKEWEHPIYNSSSVQVSKDSSKVMLFNAEGDIIVNDVVQEMPKEFDGQEVELLKAHLDDQNNILIIWVVNDKEVHTLNGKITDK